MAAKRGRKTAAELEARDVALATMERRPPPDDFTEDQAAVWNRVVSELPPDWFYAETLDLLREYCEQVVLAQIVGKRITKVSPRAKIGELERLVRMKERCSRVIMSLATKMRLTQQSFYAAETVKDRTVPAADPWD